MDHKIPRFLQFWICALSLFIACSAHADWFVATVTVTNASGTTNGQTLTVAGAVTDTRTWTNSVFDPSTQILTNNSQAGAAANLLLQVSAYPFAGFQLMSAANGFTLRSNAAFNVTLSAGWGTVTWSPTNPVMTAVAVDMPLSNYVAAQRTNVASALMAAINDPADTNVLSVSKLPPVISSTNPVFYGLLTVTNPATGNQATITNGNVTAASYTATGTGTNLIGYSRFTNATGGHFLFQPTAGPITNSDDAGVLTNLTGTNVINWYSTFPSASNTLPLNNGYWLLSVSGAFAITNVSGNSAGKANWATLIASNSLATAVTGYVTVPSIRPIGAATTNALIVAAGEVAVFKLLTVGTLITNYEDAAQQ